MTATPERADLVERLRESARQHSEASKMLADAKSDRQTDKNDYPDLPMRGYDYLRPEQTVEWEAADEIERLRSFSGTLGAVREAFDQSRIKVDLIDEIRACQKLAYEWAEEYPDDPAEELFVRVGDVLSTILDVAVLSALQQGRG